MTEIEFSGFPGEGLRFLEELAQNNDREWFQEHKKEYQDFVLAPTQDLVFALGERLKTISEGIIYDTRASAGGSILRIYRDLRFSEDKTPYHTSVRLVFWEGKGKRMESPGFLVRLSPEAIGVYAGLHVFPRPFLAAYRDAVVDEGLGGDLEAALAAVREGGDYTVGGEHYKRVPRGYDADHEREDLLRYNGLWAHTQTLDPAPITTPDLVQVCFQHCLNMAPLHQWLVAVGRQFGV